MPRLPLWVTSLLVPIILSAAIARAVFPSGAGKLFFLGQDKQSNADSATGLAHFSRTSRNLMNTASEVGRTLQFAATLCLSEDARKEARRVSVNEALDAATSYLDIIYAALQGGSTEFTESWIQIVNESSAVFLYDTALGLFLGGDCSGDEDRAQSRYASASRVLLDYAIGMTALLSDAAAQGRERGILKNSNDAEEKAYFTMLAQSGRFYCAMTNLVESSIGVESAGDTLPTFFSTFESDLRSFASVAPGGFDADKLFECRGSSSNGKGSKGGMAPKNMKGASSKMKMSGKGKFKLMK